ncbi:MAG TPA: hypothetical protein VKZ97_03975 [Flavobacteriaceae bacterium]|nr:hypothetical protein [Flavobacteriaceae bacterium]
MKLILPFLVSFWFSLCFAQQQESQNLLKIDSLWTKEVFEFPIHFAPELNYKGIEEAYFPKGWSKLDSPDYWSYVFVWQVEGKIQVSEQRLEHDLQVYFDGLMQVVNKDKDFEVPKSTVVFVKKSENIYKGRVRLFNAFHTQNRMVLNTLVSVFYNKNQEKTFLLFKFSPSDFDTDIWKILNSITLKDKFM